MYDHTLHCCYCLKAFSATEILKSHISDCLKNIGKQMIKMPKNGECVIFENYERKIKSPFKILKNKIQMSLIQTSMENMFAVVVIN